MKAGGNGKKIVKAKRSMVEEILIELFVGTGRVSDYRHPFSSVHTLSMYTEDDERIRRLAERRREIWRLRQRRWITEHREGNRVIQELTTNGRIAALEVVMKQTTAILPDDQRWTIAFDFPEGARAARQLFRRSLKRIGCTLDQLSVWHTNKDIGREMQEFVRLLKLTRWVHIILSKRI
jgi:DNA-binding transcriptional regulator PaaX